jgi:hypothetical protein
MPWFSPKPLPWPSRGPHLEQLSFAPHLLNDPEAKSCQQQLRQPRVRQMQFATNECIELAQIRRLVRFNRLESAPQRQHIREVLERGIVLVCLPLANPRHERLQPAILTPTEIRLSHARIVAEDYDECLAGIRESFGVATIPNAPGWSTMHGSLRLLSLSDPVEHYSPQN